MQDNQPIFEPTRSFAYHFVRYTVLPEVSKKVSELGERRFLLREIASPIIESLLTQDQLEVRVKKAQSDRVESMTQILRYYVYFLARELDLFQSLGDGYFQSYSEADVSDDELMDAAVESGDEEADEFDGWIYAFSFPSIVKPDESFPIKIGRTVGDVDTRVNDQVRGSASFEQPIILGRWQVKRVVPSELAIHNVLKARSKWRENAPGHEWFNTTITEVESIIKFVIYDKSK